MFNTLDEMMVFLDEFTFRKNKYLEQVHNVLKLKEYLRDKISKADLKKDIID